MPMLGMSHRFRSKSFCTQDAPPQDSLHSMSSSTTARPRIGKLSFNLSKLTGKRDTESLSFLKTVELGWRQTRAGTLHSSFGGNETSGSSESKGGHVGVGDLEAALCDRICFMEDADVCVLTDSAVKGTPCRQVKGIAVLSIADQVIRALPVLNEDDCASEPNVAAEKPR